MLDFLCQIEILLLNIIRLLKISGFSKFFFQKFSNSGFFSLNHQTPVLSGF